MKEALLTGLLEQRKLLIERIIRINEMSNLDQLNTELMSSKKEIIITEIDRIDKFISTKISLQK